MSHDRFQEHRRHLAGIAYRMLGSSAEAEDAVQDTWLRWQSADERTIADARAWLSKTLTRLCIDRLTSARARREVYPGTWLPEPVLTTSPIDRDSIELGFLALLERLNPLERAVFLLHQVFEYPHGEIGEMLGVEVAASRQLLHRAKLHVAAGRPRFEARRETHERLLHAFADALARGDVGAISSVLTEDAVLYGDGGGKVRGAILRPIEGNERVARFFVGLLAKTSLPADLTVQVQDANGWPALIGRAAAGVTFVMMIEVRGELIATVQNIVNPEKLVLRYVD